MAYVVMTKTDTIATKDDLTIEQHEHITKLYEEGKGVNAIRDYLISEKHDFVEKHETEEYELFSANIDIDKLVDKLVADLPNILDMIFCH